MVSRIILRSRSIHSSCKFLSISRNTTNAAAIPATRKSRRISTAALSISLLAVSLSSYTVGSLFPPDVATLLKPRAAAPPPAAGSKEAAIHAQRLEDALQELPIVKRLMADETYYSRRASTREIKGDSNTLTRGMLRKPGGLMIPPVVFAPVAAEDSAVIVLHLGTSLCGHEGIIHGGLIATIFDEAMARQGIVNLPGKAAVTAKLEISYKAPCRANQFVVLRTKLNEIAGRKTKVSAELYSEGDQLLAQASGLFIEPKWVKLMNTDRLSEILGAAERDAEGNCAIDVFNARVAQKKHMYNLQSMQPQKSIKGFTQGKRAKPSFLSLALMKSSHNSGLFGYENLQRPDDLESATTATQAFATKLVHEISSSPAGADVVYKVDLLSDSLCAILDLCEVLRNLDPRPDWKAAASKSYGVLYEFMMQLNTNIELYSAIVRTLECKDLDWDQRSVAQAFARDFEKYGIHLNDADRKIVVRLSSEIDQHGQDFQSAEGPAHTIKSQAITFSAQEVQGFPINFTGLIEANSQEARIIARYSPNPEVREKAWRLCNSSDRSGPLASMEMMLKKRAQLSKLLGQSCWADVSLQSSMAASSDGVETFLESILSRMRPVADHETERLNAAKAEALGLMPNDASAKFMPWDVGFYFNKSEAPVPSVRFGLDQFISGTSKLCFQLFGVRFKLAPLDSGECCGLTAQQAQKLNILDSNNALIGILYLDIMPREGKDASQAACFTIRCARQLNDMPSMSIGSQRILRSKTSASHEQLPIILLGMTLDLGSDGTIHWTQAETLLHEMGHVMHTMLGRTRYHHVAGTRCATDLAEVPSILMESFLTHPSTLPIFGLSDKQVKEAITVLNERSSTICDTDHRTALLALLDQAYHSAEPLKDDWDSTTVWHDLQRKENVPYVHGTSSQVSFTHLNGYAGTYYAYLFSKAIASKVWFAIFSQNPLDSENGLKWREEVLRWGGGKDPWLCLSSLLQDPSLSSGGSASIRTVAKWAAVSAKNRGAT